MSSIVVSGDTSGSCTLVAPAVAGSSVLTLPVATDTLVGKATTDTLTNKTLTSPVISGTPSGVGTLTSGTAVASTSGTSIDFTGIPSWAKRITVMFSVVSTNGTSHYQIQIGDSGGIETSGYAGNFNLVGNTLAVVANITSGFGVWNDSVADILSGQAILSLLDASTNTWVISGVFGRSNNTYTALNGAAKSLSATLDRVRITTISGTPTFDAGSINIMYE